MKNNESNELVENSNLCLLPIIMVCMSECDFGITIGEVNYWKWRSTIRGVFIYIYLINRIYWGSNGCPYGNGNCLSAQ